MHYFFDIHDGSDFRDPIGADFPTDRQALREACRILGEIIRDEATGEGMSYTCSIRPEDGRPPMKVSISVDIAGVN